MSEELKYRKWYDTCPSCGSPTIRQDHFKYVFIFKCSNPKCRFAAQHPKDYCDDEQK